MTENYNSNYCIIGFSHATGRYAMLTKKLWGGILSVKGKRAHSMLAEWTTQQQWVIKRWRLNPSCYKCLDPNTT